MSKRRAFYFLLAFIILLATSPVSRYSREHGMWVVHIIIFVVVAALVKNRKEISGKILAGFLLGAFLFFVDVIFEGFDFSDFGLFETLLLFSYLVAVTNGYLFAKAGSLRSRVLIVAVSILFCLVAVFYLAGKLLHFDRHGNFTGSVYESLPPTLLLVNEAGDTVNVNNHDDKLYILDLWTTTCGYCFKQFPDLETFFNRYKSDSGMVIVAVNIPYSSDTPGMAMSMIRQNNYSFPVGIGIDSLNVRVGVFSYPAVIAVKNGKKIYRGDIYGVNELVEKELN